MEAASEQAGEVDEKELPKCVSLLKLHHLSRQNAYLLGLIKALQTSQAKLESAVGGCMSKLEFESLRTRLAAQDDRLAKGHSTQDHLMERLSSVEYGVTHVREECNRLQTSLEELKTLVNTNVSPSRENAITVMIQRLAIRVDALEKGSRERTSDDAAQAQLLKIAKEAVQVKDHQDISDSLQENQDELRQPPVSLSSPHLSPAQMKDYHAVKTTSIPDRSSSIPNGQMDYTSIPKEDAETMSPVQKSDILLDKPSTQFHEVASQPLRGVTLRSGTTLKRTIAPSRGRPKRARRYLDPVGEAEVPETAKKIVVLKVKVPLAAMEGEKVVPKKRKKAPKRKRQAAVEPKSQPKVEDSETEPEL